MVGELHRRQGYSRCATRTCSYPREPSIDLGLSAKAHQLEVCVLRTREPFTVQARPATLRPEHEQDQGVAREERGAQGFLLHTPEPLAGQAPAQGSAAHPPEASPKWRI